MYDDLSLREDEDTFGMALDNDKVSSQDTQSVQDDVPEASSSVSVGKSRPTPEAAGPSGGRRPSTQMKSPLPTLATVYNPLPTLNNAATSSLAMKPASVPTRPAGEGLKYASAAAAAAASDRLNLGISPLPPPPGSAAAAGFGTTPTLAAAQLKASTTSSPSTGPIQMAQPGAAQQVDKPTASASASATTSTPSSAGPAAPGQISRPETTRAGPSRGKAPAHAPVAEAAGSAKCMSLICSLQTVSAFLLI